MYFDFFDRWFFNTWLMRKLQKLMLKKELDNRGDRSVFFGIVLFITLIILDLIYT